MPKNFPYAFLPVKAGHFVILKNGDRVEMTHGGLAVVFDDCVLGPFKSRHEAEINASYHARKLLDGGR